MLSRHLSSLCKPEWNDKRIKTNHSIWNLILWILWIYFCVEWFVSWLLGPKHFLGFAGLWNWWTLCTATWSQTTFWYPWILGHTYRYLVCYFQSPLAPACLQSCNLAILPTFTKYQRSLDVFFCDCDLHRSANHMEWTVEQDWLWQLVQLCTALTGQNVCEAVGLRVCYGPERSPSSWESCRIIAATLLQSPRSHSGPALWYTNWCAWDLSFFKIILHIFVWGYRFSVHSRPLRPSAAAVHPTTLFHTQLGHTHNYQLCHKHTHAHMQLFDRHNFVAHTCSENSYRITVVECIGRAQTIP